MSKIFRSWNPDQSILFPPSVLDLVSPGHLVHFVRDMVTEDLDLSEIVECYTEERGYAPCHAVTMTALLLYAYCQGINSSRRMARACEERADFMAVTELQKPDFRRINLFLQRHLPSLRGPFVPVLRLRLERAGQRSRCRLREQVVEPVFGTIKKGRGFRQYLLRGVEKVAGEWSLICTAHDLRQLAAVRA